MDLSLYPFCVAIEMQIGNVDFHLLASSSHYEIPLKGIDLNPDSSELLHKQYQHGRHPRQNLFQIDDAYQESKDQPKNIKRH